MRSMSLEEARKQVRQLRDELAKERAVIAGGTRPENPGRIGLLRKTIARLLTVMGEKEAAGAAGKAQETAVGGKQEKAGSTAVKAGKKESGKKEGSKKRGGE